MQRRVPGGVGMERLPPSEAVTERRVRAELEVEALEVRSNLESCKGLP